MAQTILPFILTEAKKRDPKLTAFAGLPLISETYRRLGLDRVVAQQLRLKERGWAETTIVEALVALQVAGGTCMDDVQWLAADASRALYSPAGLPSPAAIRRFLHLFDEPTPTPRVPGTAVIPPEGPALAALNAVHRHTIQQMVAHRRPRWITLDVDATVAWSEKQSCLGTYKGGTGYQPIQAIWAETQLIVAEEFRDGNVPAHTDALRFLQRCVANLPAGLPFCLRSDGAWYQWDVMDYCTPHQIPFAISADCSRGLMRFVHALPDSAWQPLRTVTAQGVVPTGVEYAELAFSTAGLAQHEIRQRMLGYRYLVIRTPATQPDLFTGDYSYHAVCTNMNWQAERLIWWHHERSGTIEHVIARLKHDYAGHTFPCGTFGANAAWWRLTCLAHNLVQCLKLLALPATWFYCRLKTLRFRLFGLAGRVITHARRTGLQLARGHPAVPIYQHARQRLATL
ncbi:MAG: IS1380 family transposase [Deltaproteobacteria bacterium]|nr:IS1380 family transposase [Deltaproteobacteria bacterium]